MDQEDEVEVRLTVGELRALVGDDPVPLLTSARVKLRAALDAHADEQRDARRRLHRLIAADLLPRD